MQRQQQHHDQRCNDVELHHDDDDDHGLEQCEQLRVRVRQKQLHTGRNRLIDQIHEEPFSALLDVARTQVRGPFEHAQFDRAFQRSVRPTVTDGNAHLEQRRDAEQQHHGDHRLEVANPILQRIDVVLQQ